MRILVSFAMALLMALTCAAQECHSLNGVWKLNRSLTNFAGDKSPDQQAESMQVSIRQGGQNIHENWTLDGSQIKGSFGYSFLVNGQEQQIPNPDKNPLMPASVVSQWQNCTLLVTIRTNMYGLMLMSRQRTYVLSESGKRLTILEESHTLFGDSERSLVFDSFR
jgi:hypothetical protein